MFSNVMESILGSSVFLSSAATSVVTQTFTTLRGIGIGIGVFMAGIGAIATIEIFNEESAGQRSKGVKQVGVGLGIAGLSSVVFPLIAAAFPSF